MIRDACTVAECTLCFDRKTSISFSVLWQRHAMGSVAQIKGGNESRDTYTLLQSTRNSLDAVTHAIGMKGATLPTGNYLTTCVLCYCKANAGETSM